MAAYEIVHTEKIFAENSVSFNCSTNGVKIVNDNQNSTTTKLKKTNSQHRSCTGRLLGKCTSESLMQRLRRKRCLVRQRVQMECGELIKYFQRNNKLAESSKRLKSQIWSSVVTILLVKAKDLPLADDGSKLTDIHIKFRLIC